MATATFDKPLNEDLAKLESHLDDIGIVVDGNKTSYASGAAQGQYVVLKNSSIVDSGSDMLADGLYTAAKAIPYNTVIDKTYLTQCPGGGLNALNSNMDNYAIAIPSNTNFGYGIALCQKEGNRRIVKVDFVTTSTMIYFNSPLFQLPSDFIPSSTTNSKVTEMFYADSGYYHYSTGMQINTSGEVLQHISDGMSNATRQLIAIFDYTV